MQAFGGLFGLLGAGLAALAGSGGSAHLLVSFAEAAERLLDAGVGAPIFVSGRTAGLGSGLRACLLRLSLLAGATALTRTLT